MCEEKEREIIKSKLWAFGFVNVQLSIPIQCVRAHTCAKEQGVRIRPLLFKHGPSSSHSYEQRMETTVWVGVRLVNVMKLAAFHPLNLFYMT